MKRSGWLVLLALYWVSNIQAASPSLPVWQPAQLVKSVQTDVSSQHTGRDYRIFVSAPTTPPPAAGYPVVYVLDGNVLFAPLALQARGADLPIGRAQHPPVIIVGIGYPLDDLYDFKARADDYTPLRTAPDTEPADVRQSNAALFLRFIQDELKPQIESQYPINPQQQSLFGHSFGGLFTLYTLLHAPNAFTNYIAASPSLWWDRSGLLSVVPALDQKLRTIPSRRRLLLTVGSAEQPSGKPSTPREHKLASRRMRSNLDELYQALQPLRSQGLDSMQRINPDADHGSNSRLTNLQVLSFVTGELLP